MLPPLTLRKIIMMIKVMDLFLEESYKSNKN